MTDNTKLIAADAEMRSIIVSFAENVAVLADEFGLPVTATTDQVVAGFDRWLAEHDREVAAKALEDAARKMQDGIGEAYNPSRVDYAQQKHEARARRAWLRSRAADVREGRFS